MKILKNVGLSDSSMTLEFYREREVWILLGNIQIS